jgi:hypothetical protein
MMAIFNRVIITIALVGAGLSPAYGQVSSVEAEQVRARQPIVTMETVLVGAITTGAQNVILEVRNVIPAYSPRTVPARVSGVRLDGYGVLFHVDVPMLPLPFMWDAMVLEMQTRNTLMRIQQLRTQALNIPSGPESERLRNQANQLEQELTLGNFRVAQPSRGTVAASSLIPVGVERSTPLEPSVMDDPAAAYTRAIKSALIDAMLNNSQALGVKADEWLTIVARDGVPANPQSPGDAIDASIQVIKVKGSTLAAFQARTISIEEARKQVEVTEQ